MEQYIKGASYAKTTGEHTTPLTPDMKQKKVIIYITTWLTIV